jgi:hypothetical protein
VLFALHLPGQMHYGKERMIGNCNNSIKLSLNSKIMCACNDEGRDAVSCGSLILRETSRFPVLLWLGRCTSQWAPSCAQKKSGRDKGLGIQQSAKRMPEIARNGAALCLIQRLLHLLREHDSSSITSVRDFAGFNQIRLLRIHRDWCTGEGTHTAVPLQFSKPHLIFASGETPRWDATARFPS